MKGEFETNLERDFLLAKKLRRSITKMKHWDKEHLLAMLKRFCKRNGIRMPILYGMLEGRWEGNGLPLPEILVIFGKEWTLEHLA